jgi:hypothetical protein
MCKGCKLDCSNGLESVGVEATRVPIEVMRDLMEVVRVPLEAVGVFLRSEIV